MQYGCRIEGYETLKNNVVPLRGRTMVECLAELLYREGTDAYWRTCAECNDNKTFLRGSPKTYIVWTRWFAAMGWDFARFPLDLAPEDRRRLLQKLQKIVPAFLETLEAEPVSGAS